MDGWVAGLIETITNSAKLKLELSLAINYLSFGLIYSLICKNPILRRCNFRGVILCFLLNTNSVFSVPDGSDFNINPSLYNLKTFWFFFFFPSLTKWHIGEYIT